MADTMADHRNDSRDSHNTGHRSFCRGLSWWSLIRAELWGFMWFVGTMLWALLMALLLITGFIVAAEHSFWVGLLIVMVTIYLIERTGP